MTRSFTFLVNPNAGGGGAATAAVPVARRLRQAGARVEMIYSPGARAVRPLVEDAVAGGRVVVAVGGDGMIASLVGPVGDAGGTLGLVPGGRGNDFARMLGIPHDAPGQARLLLRGELRRVDLLSFERVGAEPRLVAGSVYAGEDARAAAYVDRLGLLPQRAQYPAAALRVLSTYRASDFAVAVDGAWRHYRAGNLVVANSAYYGGGMKVAPSAEVDDGLLDVVVFEAGNRFDLMRSLPMLYDGSHVERPDVQVMRGKRVELRAGAGEVLVGADGEPMGRLPAIESAPVTVEVVPDRLAVLAPAD